MSHRDAAGDAPLAVVGTGKVACALGRALAEAGCNVAAVAGRDAERTRRAAEFIAGGTAAVTIEHAAARCDSFVIAVSDGAVEHVAAVIAAARGGSGRYALHTSGVKGAEALAALKHRGFACGTMHPLQTLASPVEGMRALNTCYFAVGGDADAAAFAEDLVKALGARAFRIDDAARPLYHCAAVLASNYVSGLLDAAVAVMAAAGIDRDTALDALTPLFTTAARNTVSLGPAQALTGPIARGDAATVESHLRALAVTERSIAQVYAAMGLYVAGMARRNGLPDESALAVTAVLESRYA